MVANCPNGKIRRKAYTRKDGTYVKSTCVPDKGKRGKTPKSKKVLPKPTPGSLGKYGYHNVKTTLAGIRRKALVKAVKATDYATIIRRVNLIANYSKNSDPVLYKRMRSDIAWMQKNLKSKYSAAARKSSRKTSRKPSRKTARKPSRKTARKSSRKTSRKPSRKTARKSSRKTSKRTPRKRVKAGTKNIGGRNRQLYHLEGSKSKFYIVRQKDGTFAKRYVH